MKDKILELENKISTFQKELSELKVLANKEEEFKVGDYAFVENACVSTHLIGKISMVKKVTGESVYLEGSIDFDKGSLTGFLRKATVEEIEKHLIEEANKRYTLGTKYKNGSRNLEVKGEFKVNSTGTTGFYITDGYGGCVYENGKWSQILPSHPIIEINGYKAEFKEWGLDFNNGCAKIDKHVFIDFARYLEISKTVTAGNKYITSVKIGAGEFTIQQIQEISNYYTK